jgi:hypothetical protein
MPSLLHFKSLKVPFHFPCFLLFYFDVSSTYSIRVGLTYPGEWGFPISALNRTLGAAVYGWSEKLWLYPVTGTGVWFNTGKTAGAFNKIHWLLKFGVPTFASSKRAAMDKMANIVCPNYQQRTSCQYCSNPLDPTRCCCHGHGGLNLGMQVVDTKNQLLGPTATWDDALDAVAHMYESGFGGNEGEGVPAGLQWPNGTYFCYVNLLDYPMTHLFEKQSIDSVQMLAEPQHGGYHSQPGYAFEVHFHAPYQGNNYM